MTQTLIRGRTLSFHAEPKGPADDASYTYHEDGALLVADGLIIASGDYAEVKPKAAQDAEEIDHRPHLLLAGMIDTHIHFPQVQVIASWGAQLLDWLNTYTFPAEAKYADEAHCAAMAEAFLDQLTAYGTTTPVTYCSVHKQSAEALFAEAELNVASSFGSKLGEEYRASTAPVFAPATAAGKCSRTMIA